MLEIKYGWGEKSTYYHKLHYVNTYGKAGWYDCSTWMREPHNSYKEAVELGLKPCPRCLYAQAYLQEREIEL